MNALLSIAWRSGWNRRATLALVAFSIGLSTFLLLGFERLRGDIRDSFSQSVSGTDLIVGARTGSVQLMLYSIFHLGGATNNIRMDSVYSLEQNRDVAWVVPLSLGDSHRGFPVLATTPEFFTRFQYGYRQHLALASGRLFDGSLDGLYDTVIGAEVADALDYRLGQHITLSHGAGGPGGIEHADKPFTIAGILKRTGTPVDRTVHISLGAMEAIHLDWVGGAPMPGVSIPATMARKFDLAPKQVTAALVGLRSRSAVFKVQRFVAEYPQEALMAVLPGVALDQLWDVVGVGEKALLALSALVAVVSFAGLIAVILAGLNERPRELAVLRAVGAGPRQVLLLLLVEGTLVAVLGVAFGAALVAATTFGLGPWIQSRYGILLAASAPSSAEWQLTLEIVGAGVVASLIPAWRAYRLSLVDGLSPRV